MQTVVITPPDQPVVAASTARARLGLTASVTDDTIASFVAAAAQPLDGPEGWLGRALGVQTLELQMESFPWAPGWDVGCACPSAGCSPYNSTIKLLCPPIRSIVSVKYVDGAGVLQTLDSSTYELDGRNLTPTYGNGWPSARYQPRAVLIRYEAGYDPDKVPAPIIQAITMSVASMNSMTKGDPSLVTDTVIGVFSQSWQPSADIDSIYQKAAQSLLAPYRVID